MFVLTSYISHVGGCGGAVLEGISLVMCLYLFAHLRAIVPTTTVRTAYELLVYSHQADSHLVYSHLGRRRLAAHRLPAHPPVFVFFQIRPTPPSFRCARTWRRTARSRCPDE